MMRSFRTIYALSLTVGLAACAAPTSGPELHHIRQGVIEQITPTQIESSHHAGVGAVVGGVAGLGIGSLIGRGSGRDVARVLGVVGGAIAGNEIQKRYDSPLAGQQVIVRMDNGVLVSVTQPASTALRPGQRAYVEGIGESARVIAQ